MTLGIQKQPTADTIALTRSIEEARVGLRASLPPRDGGTARDLFFFLGTLRPTRIALTAIPVSICVTALVFRHVGLPINTMMLGGLAMAIGGLVFIPLFALPGLEGKLFVPLGIAFIVSTLASLVVSVTVTPVLRDDLLPHMKNLDHGDTRVPAWPKARHRSSLQGVLGRPWAALAAAGAAVLVGCITLAGISVRNGIRPRGVDGASPPATAPAGSR